MISARKLARATVPDAQLVAAVAAGDLTGLATLFDRYSVDVRRFVSRLGIGAADLDDCVQETFLDILGAAARFDPAVASARPWIFGLAAMIVRRRRRSFARAFARLQAWMNEPNDRSVRTPAQDFELGVDVARAAAALDLLAPRKRETFVLVVLEEMSCADAAIALEVPVATVWSRLHYARAELQAHLGAGE